MYEMVEQISELGDVMNNLNEIQRDISVPRNVRTKIDTIIYTLNEDIGLPIRINKVLNELGDIANDSNLQAYTRTQLWNVMSVLEKL